MTVDSALPPSLIHQVLGAGIGVERLLPRGYVGGLPMRVPGLASAWVRPGISSTSYCSGGPIDNHRSPWMACPASRLWRGSRVCGVLGVGQYLPQQVAQGYEEHARCDDAKQAGSPPHKRGPRRIEEDADRRATCYSRGGRDRICALIGAKGNGLAFR